MILLTCKIGKRINLDKTLIYFCEERTKLFYIVYLFVNILLPTLGREGNTWSLRCLNHALGRRYSHLHAMIYNDLYYNLGTFMQIYYSFK